MPRASKKPKRKINKGKYKLYLNEVTADVKGAVDRGIREDILAMPENIRGQALQNAIRAGLRMIMNEAKRRVPVKSGNLRKSIRISTRVGKGYGDSAAALKAGGKGAKHAHLVEFGHVKGKGKAAAAAKPFMRLAFAAGADAAIDRLRNSLRQRLQRIYGGS